MNVEIPQDQRQIVEQLVASGRYSSVEEAILEGIRLLVSTEGLRRQIQIGIEQADRGEVHDHDTVFEQLRAIASPNSPG